MPSHAGVRSPHWGLYAAAAMPLVYFATQLIAAPFYPGYSFTRDTASMLGTTTSTHPSIFNTGAVLTGVAGLIGAWGVWHALRQISGMVLAILCGLCIAANGVLSVKAGLYPMPDPRHASWQFLMFPILILPVLLLIATWRWSVPLRTYLLLNAIVLACLVPFMMRRLAPILPEGTMQRVFALVVFAPVGIIGGFLLAHNHATSNNPR